MSAAEKGLNIKYFNNNNEHQIVTKATVSVSNFHAKIGFNIPTEGTNQIKMALGYPTFKVIVWDTESHGTWLDITGMSNIKTALLVLHNKNLISEDFYKEITQHFPKPGGGTVNILEEAVILEQCLPAKIYRINHHLFSRNNLLVPSKIEDNIEDEFVMVNTTDCETDETNDKTVSQAKCSIM